MSARRSSWHSDGDPSRATEVPQPPALATECAGGRARGTPPGVRGTGRVATPVARSPVSPLCFKVFRKEPGPGESRPITG